ERGSGRGWPWTLLEFAPQLEADAADIARVLPVGGDRVRAPQPRLADVLLVAHAQGGLVAARVRSRHIAVRSDHGELAHALSPQVEEVLEPERAAAGVVRGVVELRQAGTAVGLVVGAGVC